MVPRGSVLVATLTKSYWRCAGVPEVPVLQPVGSSRRTRSTSCQERSPGVRVFSRVSLLSLCSQDGGTSCRSQPHFKAYAFNASSTQAAGFALAGAACCASIASDADVRDLSLVKADVRDRQQAEPSPRFPAVTRLP